MTREGIRKSRSKSASCVPDVRLAILGAPKVGKSAVSVRFMTRRYIGEYQRNVEKTYKREIAFGNNVITYELKDTMSSVDTQTYLSWATCIAVIYAIDDVSSFNIAANILESISTFLNKSNQVYKAIPISYALIANKSDLKHLRMVSAEKGLTLAKKHSAGFWEMSAADDFQSTYIPLNTMIVEAYVQGGDSNCTVKQTGDEVRGRTQSMLPRNSITEKFDDGFFKRMSLRCDDDNISVTSTERRQSRDSLYSDRSRKESVGQLSLRSVDSNNNISESAVEIKDLLNLPEGTKTWNKKEKSRSSLRRDKQKSGKKLGLGKSKSYSDLASIQKEELSERINVEEIPSNDIDIALAACVLDPNQQKNSPHLIKKDRSKFQWLNLSANENQKPNETDGEKMARNEKKSIRRKFSMFKPKILIESPIH